MFMVARRLASHGRLARLSTAAAPLYAPLVGEHVHPTAVIEPGARLGNGVSVGPYCVVGNDVVLGDGVRLESHVRVAGHTVLAALYTRSSRSEPRRRTSSTRESNRT